MPSLGIMQVYYRIGENHDMGLTLHLMPSHMFYYLLKVIALDNKQISWGWV